jgi:hypothetical protein
MGFYYTHINSRVCGSLNIEMFGWSFGFLTDTYVLLQSFVGLSPVATLRLEITKVS